MTEEKFPQDELLDLVNKDDEIIGEVFKKEANNTPGLWHREVGIVLHDENQRVLLQQRSFQKPVDPGLWTVSAAGHIPQGMTPEQAAHQELLEELGFDTKLEFMTKIWDEAPKESRIFYIYTGQYAGEEIIIQKEEVEQARLFSKEEYDNLVEYKEPGGVSDRLVQEFWSTNSSK